MYTLRKGRIRADKERSGQLQIIKDSTILTGDVNFVLSFSFFILPRSQFFPVFFSRTV